MTCCSWNCNGVKGPGRKLCQKWQLRRTSFCSRHSWTGSVSKTLATSLPPPKLLFWWQCLSGFAFTARKYDCAELSSSSFGYLSSFYFLWDKNGKTVSLRSMPIDFFTLRLLLFLICVMVSPKSRCHFQRGTFLTAVHQITDFWGEKSTCKSRESHLLTYVAKCIDHLGFNVSFLCTALFQVNWLPFLILVTCGIYCMFHFPG